MKSLMLFWRVVLDELGTLCRVSTARDIETASRRFEQEGDEFLTITLPAFAKDFERSLALEQVLPGSFLGYKKRGKLPVFLGGFLELLFDRATGQLLDIPSGVSPSGSDIVFAVRQITLLCNKVEKPCTPEREQAAFDQYVKCEQELKDWEKNVSADDLHDFRRIFQVLFGEGVLCPLDADVYYHNLIPKHGPGSTADRLLGNQKFDLTEWTDRLEEVFPFGEYAIPNWRYYYRLDDVSFLEPGAERPVKVISVPKTQKTPRIIAVEPTCMQFMQQAVSRRLVQYIETDYVLSGMIGFEDQEPNQLMAQQGSLTGTLATLDLSEASDRVSSLLVQTAFGLHKNLSEALDATRSRRADVPGHGVIPISKFASMGSALTFPVEAMIFLACVFHGICESLNCRFTWDVVKQFQGQVRVYGDDIIVPVEFYDSVVRSLELFGFKVNVHKSFGTGRFRESCGGDFYDGDNVSVTRVRRDFPKQRTDVSEIISLVSLRNQLYVAGLWESARYLDYQVEGVLPHFPIVEPSSPVVGRRSLIFSYQTEKMHDATQNPLVKGFVQKSLAPKSEISGEGALLKCLTKEGLLPFADVRHLERQGRPDAVRMKLRWASPF